MTSPDDAQFWIRDTWGEAFERGVATRGRLAEGGSGKPGPAAVRGSTKLAMQVSERLAPYRSDEEKGFYALKPPVAYRTSRRTASPAASPSRPACLTGLGHAPGKL